MIDQPNLQGIMFQPLLFRGVVNFENPPGLVFNDWRLTPAVFLPASTAIDSSARRRAAGKGPPPRNYRCQHVGMFALEKKKHIQHFSLKDVWNLIKNLVKCLAGSSFWGDDPSQNCQWHTAFYVRSKRDACHESAAGSKNVSNSHYQNNITWYIYLSGKSQKSSLVYIQVAFDKSTSAQSHLSGGLPQRHPGIISVAFTASNQKMQISTPFQTQHCKKNRQVS